MNTYNSPAPFERPEVIELIRQTARESLDRNKRPTEVISEEPDDPKDAFIMKTAAEWLKIGNARPKTIELFGDLWYSNELCIMFADTNVGKSILAVQIADSISRGQAIDGFGLTMPAQKVLYFDFELTAKQFEQRYTSTQHGNYQFDDNFLRLVFNPTATGQNRFKTYAEYIDHALQNILTETKAKVLIIDNISCLRNGTEAAATAVSLMQSLQQLKKLYGLSILVLAHTPKRNPGRPITRNDLQGSKMLINFADAAFAIGESQTENGMRYIKQIKQRSGIVTYGADNVKLCQIQKSGNFMRFGFFGQDNEGRHIAAYSQQQRKFIEDYIVQQHRLGVSLRQIAERAYTSHASVARVLKRMEVEGVGDG